MSLNVRRFIKELIPPAALRLRSQERILSYDTFDLALRASLTYHDHGVVDTVARKTAILQKSLSGKPNVVVDRQTIQNMFVLAYVHRERPLNALELGGACGATYMELNKLLPGRINTWRVVETPEMAVTGRRFFQDHQLTFFDDLNAAANEMTHRDLLMAQGVLQYTRDPLRTLADLFAFEFDFVYLSRTVVGIQIQDPIITKQVANLSENGPGTVPREFMDRKTSRPLTIVPVEQFENVPVNYCVTHSFVESEDKSLLIGGKKIGTRTIGLLWRRIG